MEVTSSGKLFQVSCGKRLVVIFMPFFEMSAANGGLLAELHPDSYCLIFCGICENAELFCIKLWPVNVISLLICMCIWPGC